MKKTLQYILVIGVISISTLSAHAALVGHWKLGESGNPSGNTTALDSSGNGLNGTYQPTVGPVLEGDSALIWLGTSADFNGTNDEIYLGHPALLNNLVTNFTVMAWVNPDDLIGVQRVFARNPAQGWGFGLDGSGLRFTTWGRKDFKTGAGYIATNSWQHICLTFTENNSSSYTARFYVNTALVATVDHTSPASGGTTKNWFIGSTGSGKYFNGSIDDVQVYSHVLTLEEIALVVAGSRYPFSDRLATSLFEYRFPESFDGTSNPIIDLGSAGNDALMGSAAGYYAAMKPVGMSGGSVSARTGGSGRTDAIDLLNSTSVAEHGGFKMECWFYWPGVYTDNRKLMDYAGTDFLKTQYSKIWFQLSDSSKISADIESNTWYHVEAIFDSDGNTKEQDGSYVGEYKVKGNMYLYLDEELVAKKTGVTKSSYGERLNRAIGINRHPTGSEYNQGYLYDPAIYFGVGFVPVPPGGTIILIQ